MEKGKKHSEIRVKVNAWVDRGVAPLVDALNLFDGLWTTSSGEGHGQFAHVHFGYARPSNNFADFMERLSSELGERVPADNEYRLALEWVGGGKRPLGAIVARREVVQLLSKAIRQIAVSFDHTSPYRRGIRGTRLRSLRDRRFRQRSQP
ncbi:MAG: hypothetical protein WBW41_16550 [Verrucomicrobiia bacterium]